MKTRREPQLVCEKLFNRIPRKKSQYRVVVPLPSSVPLEEPRPTPIGRGFSLVTAPARVRASKHRKAASVGGRLAMKS